MNIRRAIPRPPIMGWQMLLVAILAVGAIWVPLVEAGRARTSGAGGCGQFKESVDAALDGDILTPMFESNLARNSEGAIITQDIVIEGGWTPSASGCGGSSLAIDTPADMLAAGFNYGGPSNRSALKYFGGTPVVTVSSTVKNLHLYGMELQVVQNQTTNGGGMLGTGLNAATLRFDQVGFITDPNDNASVSGNGGGLSLNVTNGSHVTLNDVTFSDLEASNGGGFDLTVQGNSHVTLRNVQVLRNTASGGLGGGGRIILNSGYVTITNSLFADNSALTEGGALRIERPNGATGPAEVWIINTKFTGNSASVNSDISLNGSIIVHNLSRSVALPIISTNTAPGSRISSITRTGNTYSVNFAAVGFQPTITGRHVHFFFDTVPPTQAGVPGAGPWAMYAGASPFDLWGVANRPFGATQLCILAANANHSVIQQSGNCAKLP